MYVYYTVHIRTVAYSVRMRVQAASRLLFFLTQEPESLEKRPSIRSLELQSLSELLVSQKDLPQSAVEPLQVDL